MIAGVTLSLNGTHRGVPAPPSTVSDDQLKEKLQTLVTTYNDVQFALAEISNPESEDEEGWSFVERHFCNSHSVRHNLQAVTGLLNAIWHYLRAKRYWCHIDCFSRSEFSETAYDTKAAAHFDHITTMLSAGTDSQSRYDKAS